MATVEPGLSSVSVRAYGSGNKRFHGRLKVDTTFCPENVSDVFDTVNWEVRTSQIKGEKGEVLFEQTNCEVPSFWSQLATNVICSKYFYGEVGTSEREYSVRQLVHRVTRTITDWGLEDGYFASPADGERFYRDLSWLCLHQHGAFNSPVWFNVGLYHQYGVRGDKCNWRWDPATQDVVQPENPYEYPQGSACFIQHVSDNMEDIMRLATSEAMLFKFGSGTGTDLSTLRSKREKLSGGGIPSGPLSFMRVYDQIAAVVKSGGKTRRAAKMQSIKVWHPDVMEFIECKWNEEKKAQTLIASGKYEANFNGEAYSSVMFQNANLSVRVTDDFMHAVEKDEKWTTRWVTDNTKEGPTYQAREVLDRMSDCAWHCGDPGVQYDTTINTWHTCPNSGRINASNPCVTGDTLVATAKGLRRIDSLVGETPVVVGLDGRLHPTTRVIPTGFKPVFRLNTESGYELKLTEDHRVWTQNRGDVPAGQLCKDDKILLQPIRFGTINLSDSEAFEFGRSLTSDQSLDSVLHGIAEKRVAIRSSASNGGVVATADACEGLFDLNEQAASSLIRGFAEEGLSKEDVLLSPYQAYVFKHSSHEVLQQLQLMLLGFGIKSVLNEGMYTSRLSILPELGYTLRLESLLNGEQVQNSNQSMVDGFLSLEEYGEEDVYDLTEPVTDHFVANGIVVHNCSEYMFLDDTACNLSSINLMKFRQPDGMFDTDGFMSACRLFFIAQEILVDHASYPTANIARNSHLFRPLGLGYSNIGSLLMAAGTPYDSNEGRGVCGAITAMLHGAANLTSAELAEAVGPFDCYDENAQPMLRVMQMHRDAVEKIDSTCPDYLVGAARTVWDEVLAAGEVHGFRNAQATVLAPTGTISFMMDCDTTGIEPDIALVKYKQLAGGGMLKIVNRTVPLALETLGYSQPEIESIIGHIDREDTIEGAVDLREEHLPIFDCAFTPAGGTRSIPWKAHVTMMAAAQPFLSGAISKTVNMPRDTTPKEIAEAYYDGWKLGLKALAIYRDGSKDSQPLNTKRDSSKGAEEATIGKPRRERLPDTRNSKTHKFSVAGHEGYITVGMFPDGRPGELFITMAKEGSTIGGLMDAFGTSVSMSLQYGVPLEDYVRKFSHMRFEPQGYTKNPDIRIAKSLIDYIFRWLGIEFLPGYKEATVSSTPGDNGAGGKLVGGTSAKTTEDGLSEHKPVAKKDAGLSGGSEAHTTKAKANGYSNGHATIELNTQLLERAGARMSDDLEAHTTRSEQFAGFQADAPACENCGSITVRNGNCYLCHNCGNSMGCS